MIDKKEVGKKLTQLRGNKSREDVAKDLKLSVSALQMYENGQRMPRDEIKIKLANYYDVSIQELFFDLQPHNSCSLKNKSNKFMQQIM